MSAEIFSLLNWSKNPPNRVGYPPPLLIGLRRLLYLRFRAAPFRGGTRNPGPPGARAIKRYFSQTIAFPPPPSSVLWRLHRAAALKTSQYLLYNQLLAAAAHRRRLRRRLPRLHRLRRHRDWGLEQRAKRRRPSYLHAQVGDSGEGGRARGRVGHYMHAGAASHSGGAHIPHDTIFHSGSWMNPRVERRIQHGRICICVLCGFQVR